MFITSIINKIVQIPDQMEAANDATTIIKVEDLTVEQAHKLGMDRIADENCVITVPVSVAAKLFMTKQHQTNDGPAISR